MQLRVEQIFQFLSYTNYTSPRKPFFFFFFPSIIVQQYLETFKSGGCLWKQVGDGNRNIFLNDVYGGRERKKEPLGKWLTSLPRSGKWNCKCRDNKRVPFGVWSVKSVVVRSCETRSFLTVSSCWYCCKLSSVCDENICNYRRYWACWYWNVVLGLVLDMWITILSSYFLNLLLSITFTLICADITAYAFWWICEYCFKINR